MAVDLIGAAATSAVAVAVAALVRAPAIPAAARRHDAQIASVDRSLATWTLDRDYALRRECEDLRSNVPPGGDPEDVGDEPFSRAVEIMANGQRRQAAELADREIADAKMRALHEWRDEETRANDRVADILAAEGWAHRLYRRVFRKPIPAVTAPDRTVSILAAWRKPSAMTGGAMVWPDDPTQRTIESAIATMPVTGP